MGGGFTDRLDSPGHADKADLDEDRLSFDDAALTALEADGSLPLLAPRVQESPGDIEQWLEDNVWRPLLLTALTDGDGRRRLVDRRLPDALDPDTLPAIYASNASDVSWELVGRLAINRVRASYLHHGTRFERTSEESELDGFVVQEKEADPIDDQDSIARMGVQSIELKLHHVLEPTTDTIRQFHAGPMSFEGTVEAIAADLLAMYADGAALYRMKVGRSTSEGMAPGDLVTLDMGMGSG